MEKIPGYWVKPFGTGMSCIDTIGGECLRGLSVEECMRVCENSPLCSAGYHYSFPGSVSYCVPLNTTFYWNSDFRRQLLDPSVQKPRLVVRGRCLCLSIRDDTLPRFQQRCFYFMGRWCFWFKKREKVMFFI